MRAGTDICLVCHSLHGSYHNAWHISGGLHEYFVEQISLQLFLLTADLESREVEATMKKKLVTYCCNDSLTKSIIPPFLCHINSAIWSAATGVF